MTTVGRWGWHNGSVPSEEELAPRTGRSSRVCLHTPTHVLVLPFTRCRTIAVCWNMSSCEVMDQYRAVALASDSASQAQQPILCQCVVAYSANRVYHRMHLLLCVAPFARLWQSVLSVLWPTLVSAHCWAIIIWRSATYRALRA